MLQERGTLGVPNNATDKDQKRLNHEGTILN